MSKFKVGDRVRALVGYDDISKGAIYTVIAVDEDDRYMPVCVRNDDGDKSWLVKDEFEAVQEDTATEATKPTFKVGDKVRFIGDGKPRRPDSGFTVGNEYVVSAVYDDRISVEKDDDGDANGWMAEYFEPAPLTIVAGRYYKTRDGRKVGPIMKNSGITGYPWISEFKNDTGDPHVLLFGGKGANYSLRHLDLIAEWPDEPAKRPNVAAQVDTIADEYGAGAKPKFKVGDRVKCIKNSDGQGFGAYGTVADVGNRFVGVEMDAPFGGHGCSGRRWNFYYPGEQLILVNQPSTPAIVALIENGQPKPAKRPYVHPNRVAAETEARRLAGKHPGGEFGVYEFVSSTTVAPKHEWQRLAAGGHRAAAIDQLVADSGISRHDATRAVTAFAA